MEATCNSDLFHPRAYLGIGLVAFLLREFRQFLLDIGPGLLPVHDAFDSIADLLLIGSYLLGAVPISEGEGVVLDRLKVDCDTERRTELVVPRVALAYGCRGIINSIGDPELPQLLAHALDQWFEIRMAGKRYQQNLRRSDRRWK